MAVAPFRSTVPLCHHSGRPPHARAPHAGRMTSSRQVSWLAGPDPSSPSQALSHKAQWQPEEGLAADSCGGSSGFDSPWERRIAPDSLLGRSTRPAHLNAVMEEAAAVLYTPRN